MVLGTPFLTGVNGENLGIVYSSSGNASTANAGNGVVSGASGFASDDKLTLSPGTLAP